MKTIDDLRTINGDALQTLEDTVTEINNMMPASNLKDEARLIARRANLHAQINIQALIQAHLKASQVVVAYDPVDEKALDALNDQMDKFIVSGLTVSAMLALVPKIIDTGIGIGNSITGHTAAG